ncbi:MAG: hypothetical protein IKS32_03955, partial [Solobacterium sp.]|nr:hypothetical protein [Solobacterium sp.]
MKRKIRIAFADQKRGFNPQENEYTALLRKHYDLEITDQDPEYLIYSVFGSDHLKYDCVRIFYTGECITPNFNECDYAAGFDRIEYGDRYIRFPYYLYHGYEAEYCSLKQRPVFTEADLAQKKGFCSFVVSNCFAQDKRTELFYKLSEYQPVASGGRYLNNIGGAVKDKLAFAKQYKFAVACENSCYPGYTTEKIVDAFAAGAIPIYYGDPDCAKDFNPKAFIQCADYRDFDEVLERVKEIDQNDELYLSIQNEPPVLEWKDPDAFEKFLCEIIDRKKEEAFRRPVSMYTTAYENMIRRHQFFEKNVYRPAKMVKNQLARMKNGTFLTAKRT